MKEATVDRHFSRFIRLRDSDGGVGQCCTCGKLIEVVDMQGYYIGSAHCGHFMSRRYKSTRFDEKNAHLQCASCNTFNQGQQFRMAQYIDKKYGPGTAERLEIKAQQTCKRTRYDLEQLGKYYRDKVKELEKQKL